MLLDEASDAFEASDGVILRRLWSAFSIFRGRWRVVFGGMRAWASQKRSTGINRSYLEEADHAVEQAVREDEAVAAPAVEPMSEAAEAEPREAAAPDAVRREELQRQRDEALVNDVRLRRERVERELEADARRLRLLELSICCLLIVAAVIALTIATVGAVIILSNPAAGAIVTAVALVPGGGAAILFRLWRTLGQQRSENAAARERNGDALESVQARLSVSDQRERDRMIGEYAAALRSKS